ncbi:MAG TPA: endopeptidase La [Candidatus Deferrimicrobiaceae bacterium]|nr:endopeptidase La [Candidatus Deferrimicrobiaceae bacterium]
MEDRKKILPLLPLRDIVVFPHMVVPLFIGRDKSIAALDWALAHDRLIFLGAQKDASTNEPGEDDIFRIGTVAHVVQILKLPDGTVKVLVEGRFRARLLHYLPNDRYFQVSIEEYPVERFGGPLTEALVRNVTSSFENYSKLSKKIPAEVLVQMGSFEDPAKLADTVAAHLPVKLSDKQAVLELPTAREQLEKLLTLLESEIEILEIEKKIRGRVKKQMERTQREFYLNEQMRAIQKELGQGDEGRTELDELEGKIKKKKMSKEAQQKAEKEIKKLRLMSPMSAEATVSRNYIDWLISIPWQERTEDKLDIEAAERILDEDHYGLEKVKERILEYLAVRKLVSKLKGPILCFVGPPGVGKTSLAKSIARATERKFVRMSLGGVRDEAEIRGHRRTYIGALPGKIMQQMKKAGTVNPVFLLDEVDKMSMDFRGDPSAALLEVLDPEQNNTFNDHYLDVDYDLSDVMFITTANMLHGIPPALQDRMEIIRIPGYTEVEKLHIATDHLLPKKKEEHGLPADRISFSDSAILHVIRYYTREAGVRNLEREMASILRKIAREFVKESDPGKIRVTPHLIRRYLGVTKYRYGEAEEKRQIGLATGLAWTEFGGELLLIEAAIMPGKGNLKVTGKLGEVMQESAHAALSYIRTRAEIMNLEKDFYQKIDIHIHVPEGAIPKDGPSAGITMATALASALLRIPARNDLAMTGEITLRGRILPIGGVKEKLLAAHRGGIKTVILPAENEKDLAEIPAKIKKNLKIIFVRHMDEVIDAAIEMPEGVKAKEPVPLVDPPPAAPQGEGGEVVRH